MKNPIREVLRSLFAAVIGISFVAVAEAQVTATHSCPGYLSPATITVNCQFTYPSPLKLYGIAWWPELPSGWEVVSVAGGGAPELGWDGGITFNAATLPNPLNFTYTVSVPSGVTGPAQIGAYAEYYLQGNPDVAYVRATPDPLVLTSLEKTLTVVSAYGTATPAAGIYSNNYGTVLSASVTDTAYAGTTQYVCTGWSMTGNEPASGTGNSFTMTVTNNAVLTWNWSYFNSAPVVTGTVSMVGLRTKVNTISDSTLLTVASDADAGDTLTLTSVNTNCASGATVLWSGGTIGYVPPATNRLGLTDLITYTVKDSHGAETTGTLKVVTMPVGVMIRVF